MRIVRNSISLLLSFVIAMSVIVCPALSKESLALESTGNSTFDAFINDGRFTNGVSWGGGQTPKIASYQGWGCCAYAADYVKYCYGTNNPRSGSAFYSASEIRAGDVITVGNPSDGNGHWFVVLKRNGNSLYVAEGNCDSRVRIGWNYSINGNAISGISYGFNTGYHYTNNTDTTQPVIKNVVVSNVSTSGYTVTCTVTDAGGSGLKKVEYVTWSDKNGNVPAEPWPQCSSSGSQYTFSVKTSAHSNDKGIYHSHIYAYDNAGNKAYYLLIVVVPRFNSYSDQLAYTSYILNDNHLYVLYDAEGFTWADSEVYCRSKGGHLVSITSSSEQAIVQGLAESGSRPYYQIGAYDYQSEGAFKWTDGSSFTYKNWYSGEPSNKGKSNECENYGMIYKADGKWNDYSGGSTNDYGAKTGFILEIDLNSVTKQQVYDRLGISLQTDINTTKTSSIADKSYTGSAIKPEITVTSDTKTLTKGTDYTVSYSNNTNIGTAKITITGIGDYKGTKTVTFRIVANTSDLTISDISAQSYTGTAIEPDITVTCGTKTLVRNTDYTVQYSDNTNVGTATVTVTGIGNYSGTGSKTFQITAKSLDNVNIGSISDKTYTGSVINPSVTVKDGTKTLKADTDYTLSYSNNTAVGTATVTITGKGNYSGTRTTTFNIVAANASGFVVNKIGDQDYTGSAITPAVTVKFGSKTMVKDKDYVIVYSDNTNPGTATITIVGTGNFTGTKVVTFNIVGKAPEPQPTAKFTWKKSSGKWYYVDQNGNKTTGFATIDGSVYYFNSKGIMLTGWQQVDGVWYYFASSGVMKTGWQKISKKWYYFNDAGMMLTGVQTIAGKTYGFDTSGKMLTGWQKLDGIWYYFLSGGEAATGWKKISKKWYWFYSDGSMASSETIRIGNKDYKFNSSGVCTNP